MKEFWDKRYAHAEYIYGVEPNTFFQKELGKIDKEGYLLLPCEGEGRCAVHAAKNNWNVWAFDYSVLAYEKAMSWAKKNAVDIIYDVLSVEDTQYKKEYFDCIAFIYTHFPENNKQEYFSKLLTYLKPGGMVIMEVFSKDQTAYDRRYNSGGPKEENMLYSLSELEEIFTPICQIKNLTQEETRLNEGKGHMGLASIIRLTAKKK